METLIIIGSLLVIVGIIGSIIPALPGPILGYIGLVLLFLSENSEKVPLSALLTFGLAMLLVTAINYIAPVLGAKYFGAGKHGVWGAIAGAIIGVLFFPPLGIFLGAFFGAVAGEMLRGKKFAQALKSGIGVLIGSISVIVLQTVYSVILAIYYFSKIL